MTKSDFQIKNLFGPNLGKLGPSFSKFKVLGQLFNSADFAYLNRKIGHLTDNCGPVAKKFLGPNLGQI